MSDILGRLTSLAEAGPEMMLEALSMVIDMIGQATDFSGEELERLGTLERRLADIVAGKKGASG